ncbi:MAG: alpha/beta hydrolase fold domain-containing protein [Rhizobiales bacterium]|nr:alpha/beta hydrolase fold domain-containing protein [Hyphomicrobiales bacterium]
MDSRPTTLHPKVPVDQRSDGSGVSKIDPSDPAAPQYLMLARMRSPVTLRELMIKPIRTGYIGQDRPIDPKELPPSAAQLYPQISVSEIFVPSPAGPVRCQVFADSRAAPSQPMMLYVHGGGFTVGQSEDTAYIASRVAAENGMVVVGVNYRLAPEWPFPAGLDDCIAVLRWMREHGSEIGGDSSWVVAAGDSSGGNFAAAMPLKARDDGVTPPEAVIPLCPITDFFFEEYASFERLGPLGIVYDTAFIGFIRGAYAVHHKNWTHPHVSPARGDLRGYPPTLIISGTADPLIDDNRAFAQKLRKCGNERVEHFVRDAMPHGYYFFPGLFKEGDEAFAAIARFLRKSLPPNSSA